MLRCMSLLLADIVAKVFLGWRTKIPRAADAFYARRREGPYRFIQNRSRTSVKSDAAAEKSKDQLSRDFPGRSIFDFCNNIGTKRTWRDVRLESVNRLKADMLPSALSWRHQAAYGSGYVTVTDLQVTGLRYVRPPYRGRNYVSTRNRPARRINHDLCSNRH